MARLRRLYIAVALVAASRAWGQEGIPRFDLSLLGGSSFVTGSLQNKPVDATSPFAPPVSLNSGARSSFSESGRITIALRYRTAPHSAIEVAYAFSPNRARATGTAPGRTGPQTFILTKYLESESLNYLRYLPGHRRLQPFVTVGLGAAVFTGGYANLGTFKFAVNFGAGADLPLNERVALRLEFRDLLTRQPPPLRGLAHGVSPSVGLSLALRPEPHAGDEYPRFQLFMAGGASFLTAGSTRVQPAPGETIFVIGPGGQKVPVILTNSSSFSKAGRSFMGFRVFLSPQNALEGSWSYSPHRYVLGQSVGPPVVTLPSSTLTQWFNIYSTDYIRYLPGTARWQPFVGTGLGWARYAGASRDINKFSANLGAGVDVNIGRRIALRLEFRDFVAGQPDPLKGVAHNLAPTAGLAFRFY